MYFHECQSIPPLQSALPNSPAQINSFLWGHVLCFNQGQKIIHDERSLLNSHTFHALQILDVGVKSWLPVGLVLNLKISAIFEAIFKMVSV